eukprot:scaffold222711_cov37-Prasinocladus_malaysianus.AAC.1
MTFLQLPAQLLKSRNYHSSSNASARWPSSSETKEEPYVKRLITSCINVLSPACRLSYSDGQLSVRFGYDQHVINRAHADMTSTPDSWARVDTGESDRPAWPYPFSKTMASWPNASYLRNVCGRNR